MPVDPEADCQASMLRKWLARLSARRHAPESTSLEVTPNGFRVHHSSGDSSVRWSDVQTAFAYKLDHLTTDEIVLRFECDGSPKPVSVSEEWKGFADFMDAMGTSLGLGDRWYLDIMTPAFDPAPRYIHVRPARAGDSESRNSDYYGA